MDLAERFCQRTSLLLRLIDPDDLGHLVDAEARKEIARVLNILPAEPPLSVIAEEVRAEVE